MKDNCKNLLLYSQIREMTTAVDLVLVMKVDRYVWFQFCRKMEKKNEGGNHSYFCPLASLFLPFSPSIIQSCYTGSPAL